jgi:hypothetical protein
VLDRLDAEVAGRQRRGETRRERAHFADRVRIGIDAEDFGAGLEEVDEIPAESAAGVENPVARCHAPAQQLIEEIDVDRAEFRLEVHGN